MRDATGVQLQLSSSVRLCDWIWVNCTPRKFSDVKILIPCYSAIFTLMLWQNHNRDSVYRSQVTHVQARAPEK